MGKLKPCPFCGEDEKVIMTIGTKMLFVGCMTCGARGPQRRFPTDNDVVRALWNTRAIVEAKP